MIVSGFSIDSYSSTPATATKCSLAVTTALVAGWALGQNPAGLSEGWGLEVSTWWCPWGP